jgi:hypothetical protein
MQPRYFAEPQVHVGVEIEPDVATFEDTSQPATPMQSGNGVAMAVYTVAAPSRTAQVETPARDVYELRIEDARRASRLVAVIELVSQRNKDRPAARKDFAVKCASYLQQRVSVVIVDVVTDRQHDLYGEVLSLLGQPRGAPWPGDPPLYAVALRMTRGEAGWRLDAWEEALSLGSSLPTLPLWLADGLAVPVELEPTYEETCRVLRIA